MPGEFKSGYMSETQSFRKRARHDQNPGSSIRTTVFFGNIEELRKDRDDNSSATFTSAQNFSVQHKHQTQICFSQKRIQIKEQNCIQNADAHFGPLYQKKKAKSQIRTLKNEPEFSKWVRDEHEFMLQHSVNDKQYITFALKHLIPQESSSEFQTSSFNRNRLMIETAIQRKRFWSSPPLQPFYQQSDSLCEFIATPDFAYGPITDGWG